MAKVVIEVFPFFFYGRKYFLYHIIIYITLPFMNIIFIKMMLISIWVMYFIDQNNLQIISFFEKKVADDFVKFLYDNEYETNDS